MDNKAAIFSPESALPSIILSAGMRMAEKLDIRDAAVEIGAGKKVPAGVFCATQIEGMLLVLSDLPAAQRQEISRWLIGVEK